MDRGQVIAAGTHQELVQIVGELDRIDLSLNRESPPLLERWRAIEGVHQVTAGAQAETGQADTGVDLLVDDSNLILPRLFESATQADVRITSVEIQEPNLEAVFLHLTGRALRD
jgi:ABC-2 type transport system ATP-binding protein